MIGSSNNAGNSKPQTFPGKIAIVTSAQEVNIDTYHSADYLLAKYGPAKIIHRTWPLNFINNRSKVLEILTELADDRDIRAIVLNQAVPGITEAIAKMKEARDDVFVVFCFPHDPTAVATVSADLALRTNEVAMGFAMVKQAQKQGAKAFVHYSFPRHMKQPILALRRDKIKDTCAAEGIKFIDAETLDPMGEAGLEAAQKHIYDDVFGMVTKHGEDTAFFATNCHLQARLIKAVVENHAIYPQPCCPSPYHGFFDALGIDRDRSLSDLNYLICEASRISEEKNMTDRLSSWPVSAFMLLAGAGADYAVRWINGEVPKTGIDEDVLQECMNRYVETMIGEESCVVLDSYTEDGVVFHNYKQVLMSYLDF